VINYYVRMLSNPDPLRGSFGWYRALDTIIAQDAQRKSRRLTMPGLAIGGAVRFGQHVGDAVTAVADDVQSVAFPARAASLPRRLPTRCWRRWPRSWPVPRRIARRTRAPAAHRRCAAPLSPDVGTRRSAGVPTRSGRHRTDAGQGAGRSTESTRTQSIAVVEGWPYVVGWRSGEEPRVALVSRGFRGRRRQPEAGLVPPGQYLVDDFPVLSAGPTPDVALEGWDLTVVDESGAVVARWDWGEFRALPADEMTVDIHCVTKWSKLGTRWQGVSVDTILGGIDTAAEFVVAFSEGGYTTNLPLADVLDGQAWVAYRFEDEDLEPEHGGPARLLVPHLYFWKSAKWVRGLRLSDEDEPGFWESLGYHNYGDPWREQRYWGD
jgi:DMSO/TMAO reductase YedYZ molybdopterin-dependent catalytic subunit